MTVAVNNNGFQNWKTTSIVKVKKGTSLKIVFDISLLILFMNGVYNVMA